MYTSSCCCCKLTVRVAVHHCVIILGAHANVVIALCILMYCRVRGNWCNNLVVQDISIVNIDIVNFVYELYM